MADAELLHWPAIAGHLFEESGGEVKTLDKRSFRVHRI